MDLPIEKIIRIEISASAVAWYAAIVATISAVLTGIKMWLDRPRIGLIARRNQRLFGFSEFDPEEPYFLIQVVNKGRRPITLSVAGLQILGEIEEVIFRSGIGSLEIGEGKSYTAVAEESALEQGVNLDKISCLFARTTTGKTYKKGYANIIRRMYYWLFKKSISSVHRA
jgi:hypothetical protein